MEFLKRVWDWLNGNKTLIGMSLLWLVEKVWFTDSVGVALTDIIAYLGAILAGVGATHKGVKAFQKIKNGKPS